MTSAPAGKTCTTTGALSCTVNGLVNGTSYTFTVTATNSAGTGPASAVSNAVIPATVPGAPTGVSATPADGSALVSWAAPASDGGRAITKYTVTSSPDGRTCTTAGTLSCSVMLLTNGTPYAFTVTATNAVGTGVPSVASASVTPVTVPGATYVVVTPNRIVDTRVPLGLPGKLVANHYQTFTVTGIPADAVAVTGNLTVTGQTAAGYLSLTTVGTNTPATSTLNFPVGDNRANGVTTPLGAGGTLSVTYVATAGNTAQAIFDVTGYFLPDSTGATYVVVTPNRIVDTRVPLGLPGKLVANHYQTFTVTGIPADAVAVTGNLTVTGQTAAGYLSLTTVGTNTPATSTLNFPVGDNRANGVTTPLGAGGTLSVTYVATAGNTAQAIFDVTGYFLPDSTGATYVVVTPNRIVDTRVPLGLPGKLVANTAQSFAVANEAMTPDLNVPADAVAVTGNLTVTGQTAAGYLSLTTVGTNTPATSTLNFPVGDNRANGVTTPLGAGGTLSVTYVATAGNTAQAIFDVTGYFVP